MSEKLLPCPFCGSTDLEILPENPSRDGNAWGAVQCVNVDCSTYDILKSHGVRVEDGQDVSDERGSDAYKSAAIAAWNRRTPAPEGEIVWRAIATAPKDGTVFLARCGDFAPFECQWHGDCFVHMDPEDGPIAYKPDQWHPLNLCRNCNGFGFLDEAQPLAASPVVPVGVSREVVENLRRQRDHPTSDTLGFTTIRTCDADAILAALCPTDTGRQA